MIESVAVADIAGTAVGEAPAQRPLVDEATFLAVYERNASALRGYLRRISGDPAACDDLLQETFLRFYGSRPELRGERETRAYLFRIATNLATDHWRRRSRRSEAPSLTGTLPEPAQSSQVPGLEEQWMRRRDVERAYARLAVRERAMLWLAYVEGCDHAEIAERIGARRTSVRVLLFRARRKLARLLERSGLAPEGSS
jgi:RNA polymerase sigma-70 factor (ECF subfamily)